MEFRLGFFYCVFLILICAPFFCEEKKISEDESSTENTWILAAKKFDLLENYDNSNIATAMGSVIPKLILEQISIDTERVIVRDEQIARKVDALLNERLSFFLELSKEIKTRDSLVLNNYTMTEYKSALKAQEKKIKELQEKIDENLEKQHKLLFLEEMPKEEIPKKTQEEFVDQNNLIILYKNDAEELFKPSKNAEKEGIDSWIFAKEISMKKISGLVSGSVVVYGEYASVTAELYVFPGARKVASVVEVGSVNEIRKIAENISFKLLPQIVNATPIELMFKVFPEEIAKDVHITIDNNVYNPVPEKIIVSSGFHSISIDAEGYLRKSFLYNFADQKRFLIEANLMEENVGSVKLTLRKFVEGYMFFDGKFVGESSHSNFVDIPLRVNGGTVFGYFEGVVKDKEASDGVRTETMFMMIPEKLMEDGAELETKMRVYDISKNIDKRRKMLYVAYSSLLLSLPFMFYSYGRYTSYQRGNSIGFGDVSYDELHKYRNLSFLSIGIVSACGAWSIAELVAYLLAVDKILPPKARKVKKRTLQKMERERGLEEQRQKEALAEQDALEHESENKEEKNGE